MTSLFKYPSNLISQNDLKNWNVYATELNKYNFVKRYFSDLFEHCVKTMDNPLELYLLFDLMYSNLKTLNADLSSIEISTGEEDLLRMINEVGKPREPIDIVNKLESLFAEFTVLLNIGKTESQYRKVTSYWDWENDNKCVSVKYKLSLDSNYTILEHVLRSLYCILENKVISNFENVFIHKIENLDYNLRNRITLVLRVHLVKMLSKYVNHFLNGIFICDQHPIDSGLISICVYEKHKLIVSIMLDSNDAVVKIRFTKNSNTNKKNYISIGNEHNVYNTESEIDFNFLKRTIENCVKQFKPNKTKKMFEGWIVISLHDMHTQYLKENEIKIKNFISKLINNIDYKIVVMFVPQFLFSIKHNIIYEFPQN